MGVVVLPSQQFALSVVRARLSKSWLGSSIGRSFGCRPALHGGISWISSAFAIQYLTPSRSRVKMSTLQDWAHALMNPSPVGLIIALILVLTIPIFLHSVVFKASGLTTLPSILLLGPSGSGKTSLLTLVSFSIHYN